MRTSRGTPPQNGWWLTSRRPCWKSKPTRFITSRPSQRCRSTGNGPRGTSTGSPFCRSSARAMNPGRNARSSANRPIDLRRARPGLEAVQQGIVGRKTQPVGQRRRHLALAGDHLRQQRHHARPVVRRSQGPPGLLAAGLGQRAGLDQRRGQGGLAHVGPLHLAHVGRFPFGQFAAGGLLLGGLQQRRPARDRWPARERSTRKVASASARLSPPPVGIMAASSQAAMASTCCRCARRRWRVASAW